MANIRSLPSGNWNAQVRLKGKPPQSKTFSTQAEAQAWADKLEAVIKDHKHHTIFTLGMPNVTPTSRARVPTPMLSRSLSN